MTAQTNVHFPTAQLTGAVDAVADALLKQRRKTLEVIGVRILSLTQLAYKEKARGQTGSDGITWAPLKVSTILARLRKAGHLKSTPVKSVKNPAVATRARQRVIYTVAKPVKKNAELFKQLEAAGVTFHDKKGNKIGTTGIKHRTGTTLVVTSKVAKATVTFSPGAYEIGVNTGLQLNSIVDGFIDTDGKGGKVFEQDGDASITVGFGRSYSSYFDEHRKLMPEVMPDDWQREIEEMAEERGAEIVEDVFRDRGVS